MSRSMAIGSIFGVVLIGAIAYFISTSALIQKVPEATPGQVAELVGVTDTAELDSPPPILPGYNPVFIGSEDLIGHRAKIKPQISISAWDKIMTAERLPVSLRTTTDCRDVEPERAILVPPQFAEPITKNEINVHYVDGPGRCFGTGAKLAILTDDILGGTLLYNIIGEATIDRVIYTANAKLPWKIVGLTGLNRRDLAYITNMSFSPRLAASYFYVIRFSYSTQKPIVDEMKIPRFVPGAISMPAHSLKRYFEIYRPLVKPVLVDARDRKNVSSGEGYPGAIQAPFISSRPAQLRFQLSLPLSVGLGAKFDLRNLPIDRSTPLVIFGNDNTDAAPLWTIRYLRQLNYRTIFFVEGGLKSLKEINPPISF